MACSINNAFRELLETGRKPTVAAISGMALGGGLETAMACNARLASPGTISLYGHIVLAQRMPLKYNKILQKTFRRGSIID